MSEIRSESGRIAAHRSLWQVSFRLILLLPFVTTLFLTGHIRYGVYLTIFGLIICILKAVDGLYEHAYMISGKSLFEYRPEEHHPHGFKTLLVLALMFTFCSFVLVLDRNKLPRGVYDHHLLPFGDRFFTKNPS